jgi:hypothetical protein
MIVLLLPTALVLGALLVTILRRMSAGPRQGQARGLIHFVENGHIVRTVAIGGPRTPTDWDEVRAELDNCGMRAMDQMEAEGLDVDRTISGERIAAFNDMLIEQLRRHPDIT